MCLIPRYSLRHARLEITRHLVFEIHVLEHRFDNEIATVESASDAVG